MIRLLFIILVCAVTSSQATGQNKVSQTCQRLAGDWPPLQCLYSMQAPTGPRWTQIMRIQVEQHPTDRGMPMPRRLHFDGHRVDVLETLDQWCGPDYRYIKVRGHDGLYILRFDETRAEWHLTMFKRARAEGI